MSENSPLNGTLIYEAQLPVSWSRRQEGELLYQADSNIELLRCINILGEQPHIRLDDEIEHDSGLMRVEAKLDMVLDLLSMLLQKESNRPAASGIRLTAKGLEWVCSDVPPELDAAIWISLYLDPRLPLALQLASKVVSVERDGESRHIVLCQFVELDEGVQQLLEKMIFRYHRRQVAMSKA